MAPHGQSEFDFGARTAGGLESWHAEQRRAREELARQLGLPLGKQVEIWLRGGVRLRGELRLDHESLIHAQASLENTRFAVDGVRFGYAEVESCVGI